MIGQVVKSKAMIILNE